METTLNLGDQKWTLVFFFYWYVTHALVWFWSDDLTLHSIIMGESWSFLFKFCSYMFLLTANFQDSIRYEDPFSRLDGKYKQVWIWVTIFTAWRWRKQRELLLSKASCTNGCSGFPHFLTAFVHVLLYYRLFIMLIILGILLYLYSWFLLGTLPKIQYTTHNKACIMYSFIYMCMHLHSRIHDILKLACYKFMFLSRPLLVPVIRVPILCHIF